jgi:hypothetical protein
VTATATQPRPQPPAPPREERDPGHLLDKVIEQEMARLQDTSTTYASAIEQAHGHLHRAALIASGIEKLRELLTPKLMGVIMSLMNTELGFLTDRDPARARRDKPAPPPYDVETVKTATIAGLLRGFFPVDNEWNLISGKMMPVKNGYWRRLREYPGFSDLELIPSVPQVANGLTVVRVAARWKLHGERYQLRDSKGDPGRLFFVKQDGGSTPDNTIGKAERKALRAIWLQVSGSVQTGDGDDDVREIPSADLTPEAARTRTEELAGRLAGRANGNAGDRPDPGPSEQQQARSDEWTPDTRVGFPARQPAADEPGVDLTNDDPEAEAKDAKAAELERLTREAAAESDIPWGEAQVQEPWLGVWRMEKLRRLMNERSMALAAGKGRKR